MKNEAVCFDFHGIVCSVWRPRYVERALDLLGRFPVLGIVGARQVGKTTLSKQIAEAAGAPVSSFDLESPPDRARLADPALALEPLRGLVVLDEIHHAPELFLLLRHLADRDPPPARFLVLGSASPSFLRQGSESLVGRIAWLELDGFDLEEVGPARGDDLWIRGGFPRSFLAPDDATSAEWRRHFLRTFLERDLPQLGVTIPAAALERFWAMLAHRHGQLWNAADLARSLAVSAPTVNRWLDLLEATFVVRRLRPWHANLSKRQVRAPKVYVADSGLLHTLLGLETRLDVERHPKLGASWEGFVLRVLLRHLRARPEETFFWATHQGAELDLLVARGNRRLGFEFKRTATPTLTPSMRIALADLSLDHLDVLHAGPHTFPLAERVRAVSVPRLLEDVDPSALAPQSL